MDKEHSSMINRWIRITPLDFPTHVLLPLSWNPQERWNQNRIAYNWSRIGYLYTGEGTMSLPVASLQEKVNSEQSQLWWYFASRTRIPEDDHSLSYRKVQYNSATILSINICMIFIELCKWHNNLEKKLRNWMLHKNITLRCFKSLPNTQKALQALKQFWYLIEWQLWRVMTICQWIRACPKVIRDNMLLAR